MDWLSPIRELIRFVSPLLESLPFIRAIIGLILVFFLPGFAWTLVFFRQINIVERVVLSIALSIAMVTLGILLANLFLGVSITGLNAVLVIIVLTILPLAAYYLNRFIRWRRGNTAQND